MHCALAYDHSQKLSLPCCTWQVAGDGDGESTGDDLELGERIAGKLSGSKHGPSTEPAMWINSSLYVDRRAPDTRKPVDGAVLPVALQFRRAQSVEHDAAVCESWHTPLSSSLLLHTDGAH